MPQSLIVSAPEQAASTKRPRSAEDHQVQPQSNSAGQNGSNTVPSAPGRTPMKANIKMPPYLQKSRTEILATFQELEWKQRFRLFHAMENPDTSPYRVDRSEVVVGRNRYGNVQPWDASRIKLKTPIEGSDYVNASPIVLQSQSTSSSNNTSDSSTTKVNYIATQGPKQGQDSHFWHMVHQELPGDVGVVIMLTQLIEDNKEKCAQYYPADLEHATMTLSHADQIQNDGETDIADDGEDPFLDRLFRPVTNNIEANPKVDSNTTGNSESATSNPDSITLLSKEFDSSVQCEVRKMRLTINAQSKTIHHYLFGRWPDFGKPDAIDRRALIELSRRSYDQAEGGPRIVHCSAGVGRTGTWIALDFLVREVEEERLFDSIKATNESPSKDSTTSSNDESTVTETWGKSGPPKVKTPTQEEGFDKDEHDLVFETVNTLREQRMMMVIREVQFSFLYDVVKEALWEKYRSRPEGAMVRLNTNIDPQPRRSKAPRVSDNNADDESASEAETEIMESDTQDAMRDDDDEDPYSAVSPDYLRRGISQEF